MINKRNLLSNPDVCGVYAVGALPTTFGTQGILVDCAGKVVCKYNNVVSAPIFPGVVYDLENVMYDGATAFIDAATVLHVMEFVSE